MSRKRESLAEALWCVLRKAEIAEPLRTVCAGVANDICRVNERLRNIDEVVRNGGERTWPWDRLARLGKRRRAKEVKAVADALAGGETTLLAACRGVELWGKGGYETAVALYGYCSRRTIRKEIFDYVKMMSRHSRAE